MTDEPAVAVVSGGSRGIGRAVVLRLVRDGYRVSFCYRGDEQAAVATEKAAAEIGGHATGVRVDVADGAAVRSWVSATERDVGPVAVAVAAAGITRDNPLVLMSDEEWHSVLDTNLTGVFHVCRSALFPMMKRRAGHLITVSSVAGVAGNATQTNYSAAKAGIIGFSRALAKEVGRYGIRVNVVAPGYIDTDMVSGLSEAVRERARGAVALGRMGTATEVADMVGYLADPRSGYVTGSVLHIDGGITI